MNQGADSGRDKCTGVLPRFEKQKEFGGGGVIEVRLGGEDGVTGAGQHRLQADDQRLRVRGQTGLLEPCL